MEVHPATGDRFDDVAIVLGPKNPHLVGLLVPQPPA
jgi:hypothetical protein